MLIETENSWYTLEELGRNRFRLTKIGEKIPRPSWANPMPVGQWSAELRDVQFTVGQPLSGVYLHHPFRPARIGGLFITSYVVRVVADPSQLDEQKKVGASDD